MKIKSYLVVVVALLLPALASAELPEQLIKDFSPVNGYVVMQIDDEYLIDLDASKGLQEGDILSLVSSGEKIVHPVTNEVIGALDSSKGFLRVTRLKTGYSYARLLPGSDPVKKGDPIRRFDQVPVLVKNTTPEIAAELMQALPHIDWLSEKAEEVKPVLIFEAVGSQLIAKAAGGLVLNRYDLGGPDQIAVSTPTPDSPAAASVTSAAAPAAVTAMASQPIAGTNLAASSPEGSAKPWFSANMKGSAIAITVGDFDADGYQEIAYVLDGNLHIGRKNKEGFSQVGTVRIGPGVQVLAMDSLDMNGDGQYEIILSGYADNKMASLIVESTPTGYAKTITRIPWHLRKIVLPAEGAVLLGQMRDEEHEFYGAPFRVKREGDRLTKGETYKLPSKANIYSFAPFKNEHGEEFTAFLSETDYLNVVDNTGNVLWGSSDYFGGTEIRYEKIDADGEDVIMTFIRPRIAISAGGQIVVTRNEGPRALSRYRSFKKSDLVSLRWNGYALQEETKTEEQSGYLADFALADYDNDGVVELVTLVKFKQAGMFGDARSAIVAYE